MSRSVLWVSRLAWPSVSDLDALGPYSCDLPGSDGTSADSLFAAFAAVSAGTVTRESLADAERADSLAVLSFAAQLQAWKRGMPLFSSPGGGELALDPIAELSIDTVISSRLASVRAVLSGIRAARFPGSSPLT